MGQMTWTSTTVEPPEHIRTIIVANPASPMGIVLEGPVALCRCNKPGSELLWAEPLSSRLGLMLEKPVHTWERIAAGYQFWCAYEEPARKRGAHG